ncbi:JmjC domain-containing protein [Kitasatospora sp. LaBMicrA B282]|uniref:JmjC domain-containing protein n=1 Tax=Kitasatospora sp. LaBMicrA B282 TaxID=3420949 RepID=UPI003D0B4659
MDSLRRLVGDLGELERAWELAPFVSSGLDDLGDVFSLAAAERMIHTGLPLSAVRLFRDGERLPDEQYRRYRGSNPRSREQLADGGRITDLVGRGATLVLEELQTHHPEVSAFAAALARETGYEVDCTAFLTPPRGRGVAPHFDLIGVVLRQLHGSKRWRIGRPVRRWPSRVQAVDPQAVEPVLDVVLKEGQSLYFPRGFVHVGETTDEPSLHLTIGFKGVTWENVLRTALAEAAEQVEELREVLPPAFARLDREELLRQRIALLTAHLAGLDWAALPPAALQPRQPSAARAAGSLEAALRRRAAD